MIRLYDYILESKEDEAKDKLLTTLQNNSGDLKSFVATLNKALKLADKGDNAKLWMAAIKDLFSGKDGDQYKASNHVAVKISELYPTQSEIDIENSAKWITKDWGAKGVKDMFKGGAFGKSFPVPVLVYEEGGKNWIIDGHHRWSQVGLINPEGSLDCMVVSGPVPAKDFLKITQGAIAAVITDENGNNGKNGDKQLPVGKANPDNNIFGGALKGDKLKDKIVEMAKDNESIFKLLVKTLKECKVEIENEEALGELVMKNRDKMVENGQNPPSWAAPRPVMPQSDAAGPNDPHDAKNGSPDVEGSALHAILKGGKFANATKK